MKIKRYNEEHLHHTEEGLEKFEQWANSLLAKYFNEDDISHSELMDDGNKNLILVTEFNTKDLAPKVFSDISKYLTIIKKYGNYNINTSKNKSDEWISIESIIYESKFPDELKIILGTKKYNL